MFWKKKKNRFKGVIKPDGIHYFIPADGPIDLNLLEKEYQKV